MTLCIAYTPELSDPLTLANVSGGSFIVSLYKEGKQLVLNPGNNVVDPDLWRQVHALPAIQELVDMKMVEEIDLSTETVSETPAAGVISIAKVEKRAALRLIHHSRDAKQLQDWHDEDERIEIRNATKRRLADLNRGEA
jgi:hypothetical protein